jgi:hypothetical protein
MTEEESSASTPTPSALPEKLPLFPLAGLLLLPRGRLPLNIFERHYLAMIEDALGHGRLVGIIQPSQEAEDLSAVPLYQIGCAGRITSFNETEDGRYLVTLHGVCRFRVTEELPLLQGYRRVKPDWQPFLGDIAPPTEEVFDRGHLMEALRPYFKMQELAADWTAIQNAGGESIISALAMICPFAPNEKQALLESPTLRDRAALLIALLEMATLSSPECEAARH